MINVELETENYHYYEDDAYGIVKQSNVNVKIGDIEKQFEYHTHLLIDSSLVSSHYEVLYWVLNTLGYSVEEKDDNDVYSKNIRNDIFFEKYLTIKSLKDALCDVYINNILVLENVQNNIEVIIQMLSEKLNIQISLRVNDIYSKSCANY